MQNSLSLQEINQMFQEKKYNNKILIEAQLGSLILQDLNQIGKFKIDQNNNVNAQSIINKNRYRFESAISKKDFLKAKQSYAQCISPLKKTLDLVIQLSKYVQLVFRIVVYANGKICCFEKLKEQKYKHLDVIDCGKIYRLTSTEQSLQYHPQSIIFINKIKDLILNSGNIIQCLRLKEEQIHQNKTICDVFIYKVQQINREEKTVEFINSITEDLLNETNSLQQNIESIFQQLLLRVNYFKPHYEAEIHQKQYQNVSPEYFLEKVRQCYSNVKCNNGAIKTQDYSDNKLKNNKKYQIQSEQFTQRPTKPQQEQNQQYPNFVKRIGDKNNVCQEKCWVDSESDSEEDINLQIQRLQEFRSDVYEFDYLDYNDYDIFEEMDVDNEFRFHLLEEESRLKRNTVRGIDKELQELEFKKQRKSRR